MLASTRAVGWFAFVVPALVVAVALGLLLRPGRGQLGRYAAGVAVVSVVAVAVWLLRPPQR